jgi:type I restriction enzyme S subunit
MSWRDIELGQAIHIKHGFAFKGEFFGEVGDHIVLTPGNFHEEGGFRLRPSKDRAYGDIPEGYILSESDLIVAMTEQGPGLLGSSALIPESYRFLHNQRLGLVDEIDRRQLDKIFLYYLFNTRPIRGQISGSASGTKVRHTAPERIYRVRVRVPDVPTQERIAATLSAYDDLMEINRRRMALLEEAARQLYREWFVRLRFPGQEHISIVNGVPEGWEKTQLGEIAECVGGGTPSTTVSDFWDDGDITWVTPTYPYPAKAGCTTVAGRRRTRAAPAGMTPAVSWS